MYQLSKRINAFFVLLFLFLFLSMPLFAQSNALSQMNSAAMKILEFFKSPLIKTILIIILCGAAIAFATNKDSQRLRASMIALGVAMIILMFAPDIIAIVWDVS